MKFILDIVPLLGWAALWTAGGWMLAASLFRLRRGETAMVGLGIGLVLQTWLANLLAHELQFAVAAWISAAIVLLAGGLSAFAFRRNLRFEISITQWFWLGALTLLFNATGRGLGIFDDYQNLPTLSIMAAGDVPPHFALNPTLNFGYHYFLLLFAAQFMRLGNMFPWSALDLGRGLILALPLMLAALWAYRFTRHRIAGALTAFMLAFAGGTRWLMLMLPQAWLNHISNNITLIGSAADTAPTLSQALLTNWKIDGGGPVSFPFAFYTGINQPYVMGYTGISGSAILVMLLLLLTANRRRHWTAGILTAVLIASLALTNEIAFLLIGFGFVLAALLWMIANRSYKLPPGLLAWVGIMIGAVMAAVLQGGMLTEIVRTHFFYGPEGASYFDTSPSFIWPPVIVSAHLGSLSVFNPSQLFAALCEIGPVILVTPLVFLWARKSFRLGKWYEAALCLASFGSLIALFVNFKGPLFTATPRLMGDWFFVCILYFVPLVWIWARKRSEAIQISAVVIGAIATLSGLVLFGVQLIAIQKPVYATFITPMDAKMEQEYWNKLEPKALIFDPIVFRAPTVFARFTDSSPSWYTKSPTWQALADAPDPFKLRAAGFDYMYFDSDYWNSLTPPEQTLFSNSCVRQIAQVDGIHSEKDYTKDFRRLISIRNCK